MAIRINSKHLANGVDEDVERFLDGAAAAGVANARVYRFEDDDDEWGDEDMGNAAPPPRRGSTSRGRGGRAGGVVSPRRQTVIVEDEEKKPGRGWAIAGAVVAGVGGLAALWGSAVPMADAPPLQTVDTQNTAMTAVAAVNNLTVYAQERDAANRSHSTAMGLSSALGNIATALTAIGTVASK